MDQVKRTEVYAAITMNGKDITPRQPCVVIGSPEGIKLDRNLEFSPQRPAWVWRPWPRGTLAVVYYTEPVGGKPIMARYIGSGVTFGPTGI